MSPEIMQWAIRNRVSEQALHEFRLVMGFESDAVPAFDANGKSEAYVQSTVRLEAGRRGVKLWRNNVGALPDERGVPVRYGLANDSPKLNKVIKSGDLIGWRPVIITPLHVGSTIAQFVSRECKHPGWRYCGNEHETAQAQWIKLVLADGGDAKFCTGEGTL